MGGVSRSGVQGSKIYVLSSEPKEHKSFCPGSRPGRPVTGVTSLVAPYCAIPQDYLSDTPLLRAMGFLVSRYGQLGAIPPPPFLSVSPLESMRSGGAIAPPPSKRGISAILARYPMKTRQMGAIPPSAILSRKGIARYGGGISHWAAKVTRQSFMCQSFMCLFFATLIFLGFRALWDLWPLTMLDHGKSRRRRLA